MIIVNLNSSWPKVLAGDADPVRKTTGSWARISDRSLEEHADVLLGVYKNVVVTAYDITGWTRDPEDKRVRFEVSGPSVEFADLIGQPVPGAPWVRGAARPVKVLATESARGH